MTFEEALNKIKQECDICQTSNNCVEDECIWFVCKEAINKQIPKVSYVYTLYTENDEEVHYEGCPNCKAILNRSHYFLKICQCGQKLEV